MRYQWLLAFTLLATLTFAGDTPRADVKIVVNPERGAITGRWTFVIDTSDSMGGNFHKAVEGLGAVTQSATDEWKFSVIVFNDRGNERWMMVNDGNTKTKWLPMSPTNLAAAEKWISASSQNGVCSFGNRAVQWALQQEVDELSIFWVTDGGFSTASNNVGFDPIRNAVRAGQEWRFNRGLRPASITTIGIANPHYSAWCRACINPKTGREHDYAKPDVYYANIGKKLSDRRCQDFLKEIGTDYKGGYLLVTNTSLARFDK